jgi:hypothetical protein
MPSLQMVYMNELLEENSLDDENEDSLEEDWSMLILI